MNPSLEIAEFNARGKGYLPEHLGIEVLEADPAELKLAFEVSQRLLAPNGFLHAASVIALADTACGYGAIINLPAGASGFTTLALNSNFTGTAREGRVWCRARPLHLGRTTQLWEAAVMRAEDDRAIAHFRCTQMVLWPAKP